jgi:ribosome assembly protein YihI (activator of Der GTPase)
MPSKSGKQRRLMAAAAKDPKVAKRTGVPQSVAKEFHAADKAKARKGKRGR